MTDVIPEGPAVLSPTTVLPSGEDRYRIEQHVAEPEERHKTQLLEQFYLTLGVIYLTTPKVEGSVVHEKIDKLLATSHSWRNAYEIEQLLCFIVTDQQLETVFERRLAEAKALKLEYVGVIEKLLAVGPPVPADKRILLHRLLDDLQWFYSKRVQHRSASKRLMIRVSGLFIVALVTMFLVLFIQFFSHGAVQSGNAATTPAPAGNLATTPAPAGNLATTPAPAGNVSTPPAPAALNQGAQGQPPAPGGQQ
jgi:hypothetical protein